LFSLWEQIESFTLDDSNRLIRLVNPIDHVSRPSRQSQPEDAGLGGPFGYGWPFWLGYVSNVLLSAALAVLFRYADFIAVLGGTE
jgi:hypothetical protein